MRLYAATGRSIVRLDETGGEWRVLTSLDTTDAQCLALDPKDPDTVYAGLASGGVRRTSDGGEHWVDLALPEPNVFSLAVSPVNGAVYAGTEPSRLFRSDNRGAQWTELTTMRAVRSQPAWSWPPKPWTSHVRWIAPSPHNADLILVGIELGALLRTTDGGRSWQDHRPGAQRDVHTIAWHPHDPAFAYHAGGEGIGWSEDGGDTWRPAHEGLDRTYTWPVAVDPDDPRRWFTAASTDPFTAHGGGRPHAYLYRRLDGGPWTRLRSGLPRALPAFPLTLATSGERVFAGLANGELWLSEDRGDRWQAARLRGDRLPAIQSLLVAGPDRR